MRTVLTNADDLVLLGIELGYLVEENDGMCKNNNMAARDAAKITGPGDTLKYNAQSNKFFSDILIGLEQEFIPVSRQLL